LNTDRLHNLQSQMQSGGSDRDPVTAAAASYDDNGAVSGEHRLRYRNSGKYQKARTESKKGLSKSITDSANSNDREEHRRWFSVTTAHMQRRLRLGSNKASSVSHVEPDDSDGERAPAKLVVPSPSNSFSLSFLMHPFTATAAQWR
ncbi:hypothetical protein PIB30_103944, partial [Stylosanthes scabra]|nr:hypothetical protein [Stylosanthes scabra]